MEIRILDPQASVSAVVRLWNRRLGDRFPLDERLLRQQLAMERDEIFLLGAIGSAPSADGIPFPRCGNGGEILEGVILAKRATRPDPEGKVPAQGHISFAAVDRDSAGRGLGNALFEAAESRLAERGARTIQLGGDTCHFFPGAPVDGSPSGAALVSLLESRGYSAGGLEHDTAADLGLLDFDALRIRAPLHPGFSLLYYEPGMREKLESFFRSNFPGRWFSDTMEALEFGMPGRDLPLLVENASGTVAGFARVFDAESPVLGPGVYWRGLMGKSPGGLGPIGIAASHRGLGLGLGFLRACLEELAARGARFTAIDWTDLTDFYGKLGFKIWKSYRTYSRTLR